MRLTAPFEQNSGKAFPSCPTVRRSRHATTRGVGFGVGAMLGVGVGDGVGIAVGVGVGVALGFGVVALAVVAAQPDSASVSATRRYFAVIGGSMGRLFA